jgi:chromosome segregation ATPase
MNSENIQRQMDFMLEQQARFDEQQTKFSERMIELEEKQRQNTEDITRLVGAVMNLTLHVQELVEHGKQTDRRIDQLAERGKETEERLNTLILVVERYFTNGSKS